MANPFRTKREAKVIFDTAKTDASGVSNTTVAAHAQGVYIPSGATIVNAYYVVNTTFTSAADTATIAIKVEGTGDLVAGIAINDASNVWDSGSGGSGASNGAHGCLPGSYAEATVAGDTAILDAARKAASYIVTTDTRAVTFTVGVQALTAGKLTLMIEYDI